MNKFYKSESGQAIVLIVLGMVALVAIVALAIDGGGAFSDRRHAQNAVDTAVLAAALAKVSGQDWHTLGLSRAASNGYNNDGITSTVTVVNPPGVGCGDTPGPYAGNVEYVQVIIRSTVDLFFAPVIGIDQTHNCVEAIARARPGRYTSLFYGNAIASTACHGSGTVKAWGSSSVTTIDGGVFSNSDDPEAMKILKNENLQVDPDYGVSAVGGIDAPDDYPYPQVTGVEQIFCPLPDYMLPEYVCDYEYVDFPPEGVTVLDSGVYCISGEFKKADITGVGVTFVLLNKGVQWNGNAEMHLSAPEEGSTKGLLIYLPPSNSSEIKLNGTFELDISGTIFAPSSDIILLGSYSGVAMRSQWIGQTVDLSGAEELFIQFDETQTWQYPDPAKVELTK
ncbi:MAG: pilus assembly protein TadG-related protein [Chloroflexota bacterium]